MKQEFILSPSLTYYITHPFESTPKKIPLELGFPRILSWWRHQIEKFSALLALCAGNSPVPGEFPAQRPVTRSFDVFFDLRQING